jgi:hypothetical protein
MKPSLAICVPACGQVSMSFTQSLASQMHSLGMDGFDRMVLLSSSASTGAYAARNMIMKSLEAAERQVGYRFDYTFWLDSDMIFPHKAAQALISHNVDIVGATYKRRSAPYELMGKPLEGSNAVVPMGSLAEAAALPTGCLMIRREIFDSIKAPTWKVYNAPDFKDSKGEDIIFCEEARACGYRVFLDTVLTSKVAHLAEVPLMAEVEQAHPAIVMPKSNGRIIHA